MDSNSPGKDLLFPRSPNLAQKPLYLVGTVLKTKSTLLYEAPESRCKTIHLFWYGGYPLSVESSIRVFRVCALLRWVIGLKRARVTSLVYNQKQNQNQLWIACTRFPALCVGHLYLLLLCVFTHVFTMSFDLLICLLDCPGRFLWQCDQHLKTGDGYHLIVSAYYKSQAKWVLRHREKDNFSVFFASKTHELG